MTTTPLTEQQLDAIEAKTAKLRERLDRKNPWPHDNESHPMTEGWKNGTRNALDKLDPAGLVAEIRRQRTELAAARGQAIAWAADAVDAKLTAEPDHDRASALYELLLHLRGELPCTCARSGGLHAKDCRKYVPGHELISRQNQLAVYRAAAVGPDAAPAPTSAPPTASHSPAGDRDGETGTEGAAGRVGDSAHSIADADNPTPLRWGLDDVAWGDDGSVIVMMSGPDLEPYWLKLDPERAAVLRQNLAGPAEDPASAVDVTGTQPCGHDDDQAATEEQSAACARCKKPFDPTDTRFDGRAQYKLTPYCRWCVDLCNDNESADHRCVICA